MSTQKRIRAKTFRAWFKRNINSDDCRVIHEYGVSAGIPGLIYYGETLPLYKRFKEEIWDLALGEEGKLDELLAREDLGTPTQFENFMVWAAATRLAYE